MNVKNSYAIQLDGFPHDFLVKVQIGIIDFRFIGPFLLSNRFTGNVSQEDLPVLWKI